MRLFIPTVLALSLSATASSAATFNIFDVGTATLLGTFEAPLGGGALTAASIAVDGGVFNVLDAGSTAPVYDAANSWITGAASPSGGISNTDPYDTEDVNDNPITCGAGECVFALTSSAGPMVPPEWALNYLPMGGAVIDFGFYEIELIPLPPTVLLLAGALASLAVLRRRADRGA